ncbi:hypothetical protein HID58_005345 [Brassica napus]|uniref:Decapping nuclease n=1 Tax=Brassica napus TaxID=3708 RepID=A0ABQ8E8D2_BRANA|nr:hypothetical protein HID58_005345 [Brassica napus]
MRMFEIVTFNVSFGRYWVKKRSGDVGYIGRDIKTIECKPEELFTSLLDEFGEGLYYTLPFENHNDRKKLSHVRDDDFRTMCEAGEWKGVVNLFLVNSVDHPEEEQVQELREEQIRVERNKRWPSWKITTSTTCNHKTYVQTSKRNNKDSQISAVHFE